MRLVTLGGAGGIAMLLRGVLRSLFQRFPQHQFICCNTVFNRDLLSPTPGNVELHTLPLGSYFQDVGKLCAEKKIDVLFRGYPLEQELDFPLERQVVEIPDIQHEYFPEFFDAECLRSRRAAFNRVLGGAGAIGTISEFARQTLLSQPVTRCDDIFLMCPALQDEHRQQEALGDAEAALIPPSDYFLFPANLWQHKNHRRVLQAFDKCQQIVGSGVQFLFTGHPGGWERYQKEFGHLPIRHLGFVRPAVLRRLLEGARALVFFSLYEGFGMPLLEAFDAGTPVLCSNTTSLPEVGADAVLSCDPTDIDAMGALMARIIREPALGTELARRGKDRLKSYSWEQSADNLMAACTRVGERAAAAAGPRLPSIAVTEWPRFALVTPSYNQGRFLARTIDSVLTQEYPHLDYHVVDGGSTDETLAVLRSYGNRIKWISERDRGQTHAINKGFALVKGDIHGYLNSDDVLLPGALAKAASYLVARPQCDLVYGKAHFIDVDDRVLGDYDTADYSFERLMADCCISQPAAFWRQQIAQKVGLFDERLHLTMDYDYWLRIDRCGGRIEHLHEFLACTRMHPETKTLSQRTRVFNEAIEVCLKNAGFASLPYFQGLWHHRCYEESRWRWVWKRVPGLVPVLSRLHHRLVNRSTYGNREFLRDAKTAVKKRFGKKLRPLLSLARGAMRGSTPGKGLAVGKTCAVEGFWDDNWMAETCMVRLKEKPTGAHVQLTGIARDDMTLTINVNDNPIASFALQGQKLGQVKFRLEPGQDRNVVLKFSNHKVDAAGRKLSFLLQSTNLFSEQDLAASA
jgi:glycosyltransferase involved in cell wall biosynthesis